jgi:Transposase DDE domain
MDVSLFTTLTDREQFPALRITQLYARRYQVELDLRQVKTVLEMEALEGKSVEMVRKELYWGLTAYNLIRALMAEAAQRSGLPPLRLSFTRCWRRICDTARILTNLLTDRQQQDGPALIDDLLDRLATCRLPKRKKQRHEPRAVWGKPQPYAYLKGSRQEAREELLKQWRES